MAGHSLPKQQNDYHPVNDDTLSRYAAFVKHDTQRTVNNIVMTISGVHCAGCIRKIESALYADPAVRYARLNFSTGRLAIEWEGTPAYADNFADKVAALGFGVQPYDPRDQSYSAERESRFLLTCLGVAGFAAGNIMLLSVGLWSSSGEVMGMAMREFLHWVSALIGIPAVLFSGRPFFISSYKVLKAGRTNMDVPITIALLLTVSMSLFETITHGEHVYFDSAVMLMFFLLIGRYLDFRARQSARNTAGDLLSMMAGTATVIEQGKQRIIPIRDVREDMMVQVGMGERIPADGKVFKGASEIDTSLVTGESMPHPVKQGSDVYSGTMNMAAPITIKVSRAAENSLLADIVRLMEKAEQGQAKYVRIADRAARLYTPVVHTLAAVTFLGWLLLGGLTWQPALLIGVTVLIITCPCALGLAVPVVQVLTIGKLMKCNLLVKSGDALERMSEIDTVFLDKTGTLTVGRPVLEGSYDESLLGLAATLAVHSRHPLAKSLASSWSGEIIQVEVSEHAGQGLSAFINGKTVKLGSRAWCGDGNQPHDPTRLELWLRNGDQEPVVFYFSDRLRADAKETVNKLKDKGKAIYLISGDRPDAVSHVAEQLGIENVQGGMSPADKFSFLEKLRKQGHKTLMIGDGLNDAPVLAGADASISPSSAIDMAQNAADIVFMGENLSPVITAIETAQFSQKLVKQNFALAIAYNIVAIPLAVLGHVTPMIAALAMSGSSLIVIANSFRLKWKKI